ncbi:VanZ family protein [Rubripirellula reticaptiva]|uniref:VanZ like family protein n=1 Tax=Rubripirellula reticaptiva TaxID=2528013 RepID=A0A5C6F546_9BACT|nr:hypothetical protein [Rubripirellula reticaptiva]TWU55186.1 hypothetical protein Poly59_14820 [Rubripirellula reticaptiva]
MTPRTTAPNDHQETGNDLEKDSRRPSESKRTVWILAVVSVIVVAALLMPIPLEGRTPSAIGNMVHAPLFAALTIAAIFLGDRWLAATWWSSRIVRMAATALTVFAFGIAIEFAQTLSGRTASFHDAIANGLGIGTGFCLSLAHTRVKSSPSDRRTPRILWGIAGFLIAIAWWGPVATLRDVLAMNRDFPLLASFETEAELERWYFSNTYGKRVRQDATLGDHSLEVEFSVNDHPSVTLTKLKHDWSGTQSIEADVTLDANHPQSEVELWINVIDYSKGKDFFDVFRKPFTIRRGEPTHLVISRNELMQPTAGRVLELDSVEYIEFQMIQPPMPTTVRVDFLRLRL